MTYWLLIVLLYAKGSVSTGTSFTVETPTRAECRRVAEAITIGTLKYQCVEVRR